MTPTTNPQTVTHHKQMDGAENGLNNERSQKSFKKTPKEKKNKSYILGKVMRDVLRINSVYESTHSQEGKLTKSPPEQELQSAAKNLHYMTFYK